MNDKPLRRVRPRSHSWHDSSTRILCSAPSSHRVIEMTPEYLQLFPGFPGLRIAPTRGRIVRQFPYSHSIVAGGLPNMSYTTRDTPAISMTRLRLTCFGRKPRLNARQMTDKAH